MTAAAFVASGNAHAVNQSAARNDSSPPADQCCISVVIWRVRGIKRSPDEFSALRSRLLALAWGLPSSVSLDESAEVGFTACS